MPNLSVSQLRPFIPAKDFALSKRFYAALGWSVRDVGPGLALVEFEPCRFYVQDYYIKEVAQNTMLHLTVADAQAWYEHIAVMLKQAPIEGARVQRPRRQPYGAWVTFVHDPSGVLLHLCQWDP